jgi:hypothetical protein
MAELAATSTPIADRTARQRQRSIAQIQERYVLSDNGAVWQFLFAHPGLAPNGKARRVLRILHRASQRGHREARRNARRMKRPRETLCALCVGHFSGLLDASHSP